MYSLAAVTRCSAGSVHVCGVRIQARGNHVLDHADRKGTRWQHELNHTDLPSNIQIVMRGSMICPTLVGKYIGGNRIFDF